MPSSQLPSKMSLISENIEQLFVIIDTCSIVKYRPEFIDFVVQLKQLYLDKNCPIKFIISLVVLEELDKCNRSTKKHLNQNSTNLNVIKTEQGDPNRNLDLRDVITFANGTGPPRMFMRFIEEEMRTCGILISDLDPFKKLKPNQGEASFEIINNDDRILDCCLRSTRFINSVAHHPRTRVILVTEDNVFKSKATTFGIISYRWYEFKIKFKNFGLDHYTSTPIIPSNTSSSTEPTVETSVDQVEPSVDQVESSVKQVELSVKPAQSRMVLRSRPSKADQSANPGAKIMISTKKRIPVSTRFKKLFNNFRSIEEVTDQPDNQEPIKIVMEVINL